MWLLFPEPQALNQCVCSLSWNPLCSPFPSRPLWLQGNYRTSSLQGPIQFLWWLRWKARESFFVVLRVEQRPLLPLVEFWSQNFWNREFKEKSSNNYRKSTSFFFFFYKAHAYDLLGWFPPLSMNSVVFLFPRQRQIVCTPLLWSWDFFHIDDLASNVTLLIGFFL